MSVCLIESSEEGFSNFFNEMGCGFGNRQGPI